MEESGNLGDPARDLTHFEDMSDKEEDKNDKEDSTKKEENDDLEKDVTVLQRTQHFLDKEFAPRYTMLALEGKAYSLRLKH
jgi:hypothetical protein